MRGESSKFKIQNWYGVPSESPRPLLGRGTENQRLSRSKMLRIFTSNLHRTQQKQRHTDEQTSCSQRNNLFQKKRGGALRYYWARAVVCSNIIIPAIYHIPYTTLIPSSHTKKTATRMDSGLKTYEQLNYCGVYVASS